MKELGGFVASLIISSVSGAGMTTHNVVARRATEFERFIDDETREAFSGLNRYRVDALQGGAPYPDYLYACGDDHDAGEEAHWTPFQQAAATYIREIYPNWVEDGRDSEGAGLVAFMSGVVSHYIVDQNWHGLCDGCNSKGLIKNIGYADFNCTGDLCSIAHSATDIGGEFVAANQMNISWYPKQNWNNRYVDHSIGGVDDDSAWTAFMQTRWANWVTYGPPTTCKDCANGEEDELLKLLNKRQEEPPFKAKRIWMNRMKKIFKEESEVNCFEVTQVGEHGAISIEFKSGVYAGEEVLLKKLAHALIYDFIDVAEDEEGGWLSQHEKDELEFLLYRQVEHIISGSTNPHLEDEESDYMNPLYRQTSILQGWESHQQFGYALDTNDIDGDGCSDVLVGSPGFSDTGHPQSGLAELYFCPQSDPMGQYLNKIVFGSYTNETNEVYERFGATVKFATLNADDFMDVIICSPLWGGENVMQIVGNYTGYCSFYLGPFDASSSSKVLPDKVIFGDRTWGVFGEELVVGDVTGDNVDDVVISAPQAGSDEDVYTNQGEVYVFETAALFNDPLITVYYARELASHVLTSSAPRQHFGAALEIGYKGTLLVGAPYYHVDGDNGAVGQLLAFDLTNQSNIPFVTITGCHHASRIGFSFAMNHATEVLALSEIGYNSTEEAQVPNADYNWLVGDANSLYPSQALWDVNGVHGRKFSEARFGYKMQWNADGSQLAIGAPGMLSNNGGLFLYLVMANQGSGALTSIYDENENNESPPKSFGRFGSAFSWFGNDMVVASPRSSLGIQQAPDSEEFGEVKLVSPFNS